MSSDPYFGGLFPESQHPPDDQPPHNHDQQTKFDEMLQVLAVQAKLLEKIIRMLEALSRSLEGQTQNLGEVKNMLKCQE